MHLGLRPFKFGYVGEWARPGQEEEDEEEADEEVDQYGNDDNIINHEDLGENRQSPMGDMFENNGAEEDGHNSMFLLK